MRMRKRPNLAPRMEKCESLIINEPEALRGRWREAMGRGDQLHLELGCGKGRFTVDLAEAYPEISMVALEKVPDAMIIAMERAQSRELENLRFISGDAAKLCEMFAPAEVDRIYINFCDPWPKSRDAKFRLTYPGFLRLYGELLPLGGQIHFKTDNTPLFNWSVEQFEKEGWQISEKTHDLHGDGPVPFMTDYEAKFCAEGMKINRLVATKVSGTLSTAAGPVARMHNAALTDARGYEESRRANEESEE